MKTIDHINFQGKKTLIRVDFNIPLNKDLKVADDTRICAVIPTINKILNDDGSVILISHLGRPKNGYEDKFSLKHIVNHLSEKLKIKVKFAHNCIGDEVTEMANKLKNGEVLLLENLRFHSEEKAGDKAFAEKLSKLADIYINDAFGTSHRSHASNVGVTDNFIHKGMGLLMKREVQYLQKKFKNPKEPLTILLGGAKISDKIDLIEKFLIDANTILIGGGMAFTFLKAKGLNVGNSIVDEKMISIANEIIKKLEEIELN